jgi:hypothetical protein
MTIAAQVNQLISTSIGCTADADCICYAETACGLRGECGVAINVFGRLQLDQLISEWRFDCPGAATSCGDCPAQSMSAVCSVHRCECTFAR